MSIQDYAKPISLKGKKDIGILLIHGFSGCTVSLKYPAEKLNKAGFVIEVPCLAGHGTYWEDLGKVSYTDWFIDVENALNALKKQAKTVYVAGLSMGGLLALYLAQKYPDIKGIILINHAIFFVDKKIHLVPFIKNIIKQSKGVGNDIKDKKQDEKPYPIIPSAGVMELLKLVKLVKSIHHKIKQPTLIFKSVEDHVVSFKSAEYTYDNIFSLDKEIIWLKNSYHVATMDYDKDLIVQRIIEFISRLSSDKKIYPTIKQQKIKSSSKPSNKKSQAKKSKNIKKIKSPVVQKNKTKPKTAKNLKTNSKQTKKSLKK